MEFVLIFLIPIIFLLAITIPFKDSYKGRRLKVFFIITGVPFIILFGDELIGQAILKTTCVINGGYKHAELDKNEGYYDADTTKRGCNQQCVKSLLIKGIPYYENALSLSPRYPDEHYKYYLAESPIKKPNKFCASLIGIKPEFRSLLKNKCVIYEKIEKPSSKYEISIRNSERIVIRPFKMKKMFSYVKDRQTNKIISSAATYYYGGGWVRNSSFSHNGYTVCPQSGKSHSNFSKNLFSNEI